MSSRASATIGVLMILGGTIMEQGVSADILALEVREFSQEDADILVTELNPEM